MVSKFTSEKCFVPKISPFSYPAPKYFAASFAVSVAAGRCLHPGS